MINVLLWCLSAAVVILPALSQSGYSPLSLEYFSTALLAAAIGLLCYLAARIRFLGPILLVILTALAIFLYFGAPITAAWWRLVLFALAVGAFAALAVFKLDAALRIAGFVAAAQIAVTAMATPPTIRSVAEQSLERPENPAVVHLLMDEQAGLAAFPEDAVSAADLKRLEEEYVSRGFVVFRRAYSADKHTFLSVARLFNPALDKPPVIYQETPPAYLVTEANMLEEISQDRVLDLTYSGYHSLEPALRGIERIARELVYEVFITADALAASGMPLRDRLQSAAGSTAVWLLRQAQSPLTRWFLYETEAGRALYGALAPASRAQPLVARSLLADLSDRLGCCGARGTYVYAHLLLPHYPYVFNEDCEVRPSRDWLNRIVHHVGDKDNLQSRRLRYQQHFSQAMCAARDVGGLVDRLDRRPETADATVIVHGDHGSRIAIEDYAGLAAEGYDKQDYERDWRGTFMAVRIPGVLTGMVVDVPVRVDQVYRHLADNDFRQLDLDALGPTADSPY